MTMPWITKSSLREEIGRLKEELSFIKEERNKYISASRLRRTELEKSRIEIAGLQAQLSSIQGRCDRAELELDRTKSDFHELVQITSGRVPPRLGQPLLDDDPFKEDERQIEVFLTPSPNEELGISDKEVFGEEVT